MWCRFQPGKAGLKLFVTRWVRYCCIETVRVRNQCIENPLLILCPCIPVFIIHVQRSCCRAAYHYKTWWRKAYFSCILPQCESSIWIHHSCSCCNQSTVLQTLDFHESWWVGSALMQTSERNWSFLRHYPWSLTYSGPQLTWKCILFFK